MFKNITLQTHKLAELISIKHGYAFKGAYFSETPSEYLLLSPGSFQYGKRKFYTGDVPKDFILAPDELVVSMTDLSKDGDTLGFPALLPKGNYQFLHNQRIGKVTIERPDLIGKGYLYYFMCTEMYRHGVLSTASGTTVRHTSPSRVLSIRIDLPPIESQKEIAHILGTLDDKIEMNRKMNKTLEEIAQALFKHWFIDFEFPNEEGKPYKSSGGEMVDSELGLIPKGWGVGGIEDMGTICGGSTPSTKNQKYWGGNTPFVTPKDLTSLTSLYLVSTERRITLDGVKRISSGVLPENTILLSSRAPIGYIALLIEPSSVNQGFIAIQCKNPRFIQYVLLWLSSNIDLIKQYANGSTFLEISKDNFRRIKIVIPGHDVIDEFNKCCVSLFTLMKHTTLALSQLVQIRQQLLVYLINSI